MEWRGWVIGLVLAGCDEPSSVPSVRAYPWDAGPPVIATAAPSAHHARHEAPAHHVESYAAPASHAHHSGGSVQVHGYMRRGRYVRPHTRRHR